MYFSSHQYYLRIVNVHYFHVGDNAHWHLIQRNTVPYKATRQYSFGNQKNLFKGEMERGMTCICWMSSSILNCRYNIDRIILKSLQRKTTFMSQLVLTSFSRHHRHHLSLVRSILGQLSNMPWQWHIITPDYHYILFCFAGYSSVLLILYFNVLQPYIMYIAEVQNSPVNSYY